MKLDKKKELVARTLGLGKKRIWLDPLRLDEIKEAITRQDILELVKDNAIKIKEIKGRKKIIKRKWRRKAGKIRKKVNKRKENYIIKIRKIRKYLVILRKNKKISSKDYNKLKKLAKSGNLNSIREIQERI